MKEPKRPKCWLVWVYDYTTDDLQLRVVATTEAKARSYAKYIRKGAKFMDNRVRVEIEKREMNHMFADSVLSKLPMRKRGG